MRTVSLRHRVMVGGIAVTTGMIVALGAFVYTGLRARLLDDLSELLAERVAIAEALAEHSTPDELASSLRERGMRATVTRPDGSRITVSPPVPRTSASLQAPPGVPPGPFLTDGFALPDGGHVELAISRGGVNQALERLLAVVVAGGLGAIVLVSLLLRQATSVALRPLDDVVSTARRVARGRTSERLGSAREDTELGRLCVAFDEMLDSVEQALDEARRSDAASQRFLANAAHQLRNPIAGAQVCAEALLRAPDDQRRDELLAGLVSETARCGRLVADLLHLARLDQRPPHAEDTVDVAGVCAGELHRLRDRWPTLEFRLERGPGPARVLASAELSEALANLLDNAARHARGLVTVRVEDTDGSVVVRVGDDGPGIPAADAERVFERFVSLDGQGGSGLGLAIARAVAEGLGGGLAYRDGEFVCDLPAAPSVQPPVRAASTGSRPAARSAG